MQTSQTRQSTDTMHLTTREKLLLTVFSLFILLMSVWGARFLVSNRPQAQRSRPPAAAPAVSVMRLYSADHTVMLGSMGTVEPDVQISLVAETGGEIIDVHASFIPGGVVQKGDILIRVDPIVYQTAVAQAELALEQARLELRQEEGRQIVAEKEWALLGPFDATELEKDLALRKPHLIRAGSQVKAAEAVLRKARSDLAKTSIRAPFNAVVRSTDVNIGDVAAPQKRMGVLIGADAFRVIATLPVDRLPWLEFPSNTPGQSDVGRVKVYTPMGHVREGVLMNLLSDIEPGGRLARVLIRVPDPMDLDAQLTDRLPLLVDQFVRLEIAGKIEREVYRIPREYLHDNNVIHLMEDDNTLNTAPVNVVWRDTDIVYVRGDLENKRLIVTELPAPVHGMALTLQQEISPDTEKNPDVADSGISGVPGSGT